MEPDSVAPPCSLGVCIHESFRINAQAEEAVDSEGYLLLAICVDRVCDETVRRDF